MLDVHKLRQFFVLVRVGNFTKAAAELNLSQSALSRSMQSLEEQLGTRLLERERGKPGVTLTLAGTDLFERVETILEQLDQAEASVSGRPTPVVRRLGFGIGPMLGGALLTEFLQKRLATDPDLAISVYTSTSDLMTELLLDGEIEFYLGLASLKHRSSRIRHHLFARFAPSFFVRPGHPLRDRAVITTDDLLAFPRISGTAWNENLVTLGDQRDRYLFTTSLQVDDYGVLAEIARTSDAVLISSIMRPREELCRLPVTLELADSGSELSVFSLAGVRLSPAAQRVVDDLRDDYLALVAAHPSPSPSTTPADTPLRESDDSHDKRNT